ncbi:hypothetical protein EMPS_00404 [Entomortierella parvispora]|uniref:NACHT domain-containing protein n=1 Tax=Entomortierella parvispora TaxID=205924 RepID=A0A9P3H0V3_9FUNG|nr:hypothetical protein EMPS_00404 [Entomortierella parvispora]
MPFSATAALEQARVSINAAQEALGSENATVHYYRTAKSALNKIDVKKADPEVLQEMMIAFQDLALVFDRSEGQKTRADKCRERADDLRGEHEGRRRTYAAFHESIHATIHAATIAPSLLGLEFSPPIAQAGVTHWNSLASSSAMTSDTSPVSAAGNIIESSSTAVILQTSPASTTANTTANITPTTPQVSFPPIPAITSVSTASASSASLSFFSRDVGREPYICLLPGPDEPLQTTRQLARCLALLHRSVKEDDLSPEDISWRRSTLDNRHEMARLEDLSFQIIERFAKDKMKDAAAVDEVLQLAPALKDRHSRSILGAFIDTVNDSAMLHLYSLDGLGKAIYGADPWSIDSNDLVTILECLHKRLPSIHPASHQYCPMLLAVSRVLDAMSDAGVGGVDRVHLHGPLTDFLRESESSKDPYLTFQAAYATQALLNVPDDDTVWQAGFRRLWLALKGGAGFAQMPDPAEIGDMLEGLENLYEAGKGGVRLFKDALKAIKDRENPTFTAKEGLKFKRAWYYALHTAESYIHTGKLRHFRDLVTTTSCRHQLMFQWGICQLLGRFAADAQWGLESRQEAIGFLGALYRTGDIWNRQKGIDQIIFDALTNVVAHSYSNLEAAQSLLEEMRKQNSTLKSTSNLQSLPWSNMLYGDQAGRTILDGSLLRAVQDRKLRHANLENMLNHPPPPCLNDIHSALKIYHSPDLFIVRISGKDKLDLGTCFVNLAIVEAPEHRQREKQDLKEQAAIFHRIPSFEKVQNTNTQSLIPLEQLFDKRKLRSGKEGIPKRILVQGRAGIGKTTLCKRLVHAHQNNLWKDQFDAVLWLPLRQLRGSKSRTLERLFREKVFITQDLDEKQAALARALVISAQKGKVLFILDGLDEIVTDTGSDESRTFRSFLKTLLSQENVIITSRPSGLDSELLPTIDLELETVGFSQQNVKDFLTNVLEPSAARTVQEFIQRTPLIQGLVNIPVQLDVICFSWDSLPKDGTAMTMTGLYQLMVRKLWCKDAIRLKKKDGEEYLSERHINRYKPKRIDELMATELQHLGYLAFKGMINKHQIEFDEDDLLSAFEDLDDSAIGNQRCSPPKLVEVMKQTSFLHTADADLDNTNGGSRQAWYFLHLTFQEYFAATWIVRHFHLQQPGSSAGMMTTEEMIEFIQQHKYNPRYEIVWSMVAGLLEREPLVDFFERLQGAPRDLIGGRHQQILASCLNEARTRLDSAVAVALESELMKWLHLEMKICKHGHFSSSMVGSQPSFPEALLIETLNSERSWKPSLIRTLGARSTLSDSAIQTIIEALKDKDVRVRSSAASALGNQSIFSESANQSLVAALKNEDTNVKTSVVSALSNQSTLSASVIQSLIDALKDEDLRVKYLAAKVLGKQSTLSESVIRSLVVALKNEDQDFKYSAAEVLSKQSTLSASAILPLIAALKDDDKFVRYSATIALGKQSTSSESTIQHLVDTLKDEDRDVRSSAVTALGSQSLLSESAIQFLVDKLKDDDTGVRSSAATALGNQLTLPNSAIQFLIDALKDADRDIRSSAASVLGNQSILSASAIQSLVAELKEQDVHVRSLAATALGNQSTLSDSATLSLIDALKSEDKHLKSLAARVLGKQSTLSESAIRSLIDAVKDENYNVSSPAAWVLGNQSTIPDSAIQSLVDVLKGDDYGVRSSAVRALRKQSTFPDSVIQSLIDAFMNGGGYGRPMAARLLSQQPTLSESVIRSLAAALNDEHKYVRRSAAEILGKQSTLSESAIWSLIDAIKDEDNDVISSAASALGNQSTMPDLAIQSLVDALQDKDKNVRSSAATALGKQSAFPDSTIQSLIDTLEYDGGSIAATELGKQPELSESSVQSLVAALKYEDDNKYLAANVRYLAAEVLGIQSALSDSAIRSVADALQDKDKNVRSSAATALGKQSTLSDSAIESLSGALMDKDENVRTSVATALGRQSALSESAIRSLIAALKDKHEFVRNAASQSLGYQCHQLCKSLPSFSEDEIYCLYESHLFLYSCNHVISLQLQDETMRLYTEQGEQTLGPLSSDFVDILSSAFKAVQDKALKNK